MLIKVFGRWLNPNNITTIDDNGCSVRIFFGGMVYSDAHEGILYDHVVITGKARDEVANEINKQLKGQDDEDQDATN